MCIQHKMWPTVPRVLLVAALSLETTLAQNTTTNYTSTCPGISSPNTCCPSFLDIASTSSPDTSVVSVGNVSFAPPSNKDPWYISVLVNDTGSNRNNGRSRYTRPSFLSVSNNAPNTSVCLYQFSPLNATKTSSGSGCAGVFSDECTAFIQQALFNATNANWRPGDECPNPFPAGTNQQRLSDFCGKLTPNEQLYSLRSASESDTRVPYIY